MSAVHRRQKLDPKQELEGFFATPQEFYLEDEISQLSNLLKRNGMRSYSVYPKLYLILYGVGCSHLFTAFVANGHTDDSLPIKDADVLQTTPLKTVPNAIPDFLRYQVRVINHNKEVYETRLASFFAPARDAEENALHDSDFEQIGRLLRLCGSIELSRSPKLYYVLRSVGETGASASFASKRYDDIWFPYSRTTLSSVLPNSSAVKAFLEFQHIVCSKRWAEGTHLNFITVDHEYLETQKELGSGGTGAVDHVFCQTVRKNYARKVINRNADGLLMFANEVKLLKAVRHVHCVTWSCSYTDPHVLAIMVEPVADMNLGTFLDASPIPPDRKELLQTSFGCLSTALAYLHDKGIRHKDIKPQNILVQFNTLLLTDFGLSADSFGETTSIASRTPRYCPPEVDDGLRREASSDIWSLGCVFLEIIAALQGISLTELKKFFKSHGSKRTNFKDNADAVTLWTTDILASRHSLRSMAYLGLNSFQTCWISNLQSGRKAWSFLKFWEHQIMYTAFTTSAVSLSCVPPSNQLPPVNRTMLRNY